MINFLTGKKTYIIAAVAILYAVFAFFSGHMDGNMAVETILAALGAAGLRNAIK